MADLPLELRRHGERWRAHYACDPAKSRGRLYDEPEDGLRSHFQRDRDRIIHCSAFRRLKHKTQVFIHHEGDHFRTRLTHTLEVAQIARSIARPLGLDEDLAEALALAHDLGHPPFGHAGERALDWALASYEGFDHNAQSLRVATDLERRYPLFNGLNLSWETLEGLVKHNGPLLDAAGRTIGQHAGGPLPFAIRAYSEKQDLELHNYSSLEAQVAAISDDIAYDCHDIDDGLRANLLDLDSLQEPALTRTILKDIAAEFPRIEPTRRIHELTRRVISRMIFDVIAETARRVEAGHITLADDARQADATLVTFSPALADEEKALKAFLYENLYLHPLRMPSVEDAEALVIQLFEAFHAEPHLMPEDWSRALASSDKFRIARRVADYIAGMTDRYAISEHRRLFGRGHYHG